MKEVRVGARLADGKEEQQFDAIILATGYRSNVPSWLKVNINNNPSDATKKDPLVRFCSAQLSKTVLAQCASRPSSPFPCWAISLLVYRGGAEAARALA